MNKTAIKNSAIWARNKLISDIEYKAGLNVSDEAVRLRDAAAKQDICFLLQDRFPGRQIPVPYRERMAELTIDEMNLSVRSSNALMRAGARTFGRVREIIMMEDGLKKIRNHGIKSEKEIIRNFLSACYCQLSPTEQAVFWQKLIEQKLNSSAS